MDHDNLKHVKSSQKHGFKIDFAPDCYSDFDTFLNDLYSTYNQISLLVAFSVKKKIFGTVFTDIISYNFAF